MKKKAPENKLESIPKMKYIKQNAESKWLEPKLKVDIRIKLKTFRYNIQ